MRPSTGTCSGRSTSQTRSVPWSCSAKDIGLPDPRLAQSRRGGHPRLPNDPRAPRVDREHELHVLDVPDEEGVVVVLAPYVPSAEADEACNPPPARRCVAPIRELYEQLGFHPIVPSAGEPCLARREVLRADPDPRGHRFPEETMRRYVPAWTEDSIQIAECGLRPAGKRKVNAVMVLRRQHCVDRPHPVEVRVVEHSPPSIGGADLDVVGREVSIPDSDLALRCRSLRRQTGNASILGVSDLIREHTAVAAV